MFRSWNSEEGRKPRSWANGLSVPRSWISFSDRGNVRVTKRGRERKSTAGLSGDSVSRRSHEWPALSARIETAGTHSPVCSRTYLPCRPPTNTDPAVSPQFDRRAIYNAPVRREPSGRCSSCGSGSVRRTSRRLLERLIAKKAYVCYDCLKRTLAYRFTRKG